jgi:hypothetical protein
MGINDAEKDNGKNTMTIVDLPAHSSSSDEYQMVINQNRMISSEFTGNTIIAAGSLLYQMEKSTRVAYNSTKDYFKDDSPINPTPATMALVKGVGNQFEIAYVDKFKKILISTNYLARHSGKNNIVRSEFHNEPDGTHQPLYTGTNSEIFILKTVREASIDYIFKNHPELISEKESYKNMTLAEIDAQEMNWIALSQQLSYANDRNRSCSNQIKSVLQTRYDNAAKLRPQP